MIKTMPVSEPSHRSDGRQYHDTRADAAEQTKSWIVRFVDGRMQRPFGKPAELLSFSQCCIRLADAVR